MVVDGRAWREETLSDGEVEVVRRAVLACRRLALLMLSRRQVPPFHDGDEQGRKGRVVEL